MKKFLLLSNLLPLSLILFLVGCQTSETKTEIELTGKTKALSAQVLSVRKGFMPYLVNKTSKEITKHDLRDKTTREALRANSFFCKVGNEIFHICNGTAGLCKKTSQCAKWGRKWYGKKFCSKSLYKIKSLKYNYGYLVKMNTRCASLTTYPNFLE